MELGLVYQVLIDQNNAAVAINMTLTAPGCGMGPVLVADVEYRLAKVPNIQQVNHEVHFCFVQFLHIVMS